MCRCLFGTMLQVVFRKIADVLREKELAERDRNDPPVELSTDHPVRRPTTLFTDHPVRRLISRFRKLSCSRLPSVTAGLPLSDMSPGDMLTVDMSLRALAGRKNHSVDATGNATTDVGIRTAACDTTTNNNCTVSNGGAGVSSGHAAWKTLLSRASSSDVTTAAAAVATLPSNDDNTRAITSSATGNSEERCLLSDNVVPRTPRSKWNSLLSRVGVPSKTTTSAAVPVLAAAHNQVFDDEEVGGDQCLHVKPVSASRSPETLDATVEMKASRRDSTSSSSADDVVRPDDHEAISDVINFRSELTSQLGSVHKRIDDVNQRLDVILRLLADNAPQRSVTDVPAGHLS